MNARSLSGINDVTSNGDVALTMNARSMSGINDALGGGGDVFLAGGTAVAPQTFTGFNQFDELTKFKTTRPQLVATDTTTNPTANEFITKADGVDLFGSVTGNAQLDGGVSIEEPQTFTGFNEFENTTNFKNTIRVNEGDGANDDPEILMTAPAGYANLIQQNSTRLSGLGSSNRILQVANQTNEITQLSTGNFINKIIQIGANSSIETDGTIEAIGNITTDGAIDASGNITTDGVLEAANVIVNSGAIASSQPPFGGGNLNIETATATTNGRLYIGTPPTNLPLFTVSVTESYFCLVRGGIYVDGEEGIRIPRRGLYDRTGLREWRIDHYSGGGSSQSGVNCLTFNFSATSDTSLLGNFLTKARLQSNGRLELDANLLQNQNFSDARLKTNNKYLENATESLLKLSVQTYDKAKVNNFNLNEPTGETIRETGLIAQEVYYNAPEFRDLVSAGREYNDEFDLSGNQSGDGKPEGTEIIPDEMDLSGVAIGEDPDYEGAGWSKTERASIEYQGFIAYLIKSNQELHERISILEVKINNM